MTAPTFPVLVGQSLPKRTPVFSTTPQAAWSGKDSRRSNWLSPKHQYELMFDLLRSDANAELQNLYGFFLACRGSALPFFYFDPDDNTATAQSIGLGDGVTTQFQLVRSFGGFIEPVFAPIGSPTVAGGGAYSVSASGLVTFSSAPTLNAALTWTGTFNWICRFDDDQVQFVKFMSGMWSLAKITFTTVKP